MVALAFIFATTSIPPGKWTAFGAMLLLVWTASAFSGVGIGRVFLRSLVALPFILIALPTVFTKPGAPLYELPLGLFTLTATAAVLLTSTTPPLRLLAALRALRLPAILVAVVMLMYRYLFVLVDEAQRMLRARAARSAAIGPGSGGTVVWRAKSAGGMAGSLFIRTLDRGERIYMAMLARGYDGSIRQQSTAPLGRLAIAQIALPLALFAAVAVAARVLM